MASKSLIRHACVRLMPQTNKSWPVLIAQLRDGLFRVNGFQYFAGQVPAIESLPAVVQSSSHNDKIVRRDNDHVLAAIARG